MQINRFNRRRSGRTSIKSEPQGRYVYNDCARSKYSRQKVCAVVAVRLRRPFYDRRTSLRATGDRRITMLFSATDAARLLLQLGRQLLVHAARALASIMHAPHQRPGPPSSSSTPTARRSGSYSIARITTLRYICT